MTETLKPPMAPMSEVTSLIDEVRRLREALRWYASPQTWELADETGNPRARKALEPEGGG